MWFIRKAITMQSACVQMAAVIQEGTWKNSLFITCGTSNMLSVQWCRSLELRARATTCHTKTPCIFLHHFQLLLLRSPLKVGFHLSKSVSKWLSVLIFALISLGIGSQVSQQLHCQMHMFCWDTHWLLRNMLPWWHHISKPSRIQDVSDPCLPRSSASCLDVGSCSNKFIMVSHAIASFKAMNTQQNFTKYN